MLAMRHIRFLVVRRPAPRDNETVSSERFPAEEGRR
jgi:hypothetical protein